jgi:hypothetical protein
MVDLQLTNFTSTIGMKTGEQTFLLVTSPRITEWIDGVQCTFELIVELLISPR